MTAKKIVERREFILGGAAASTALVAGCFPGRSGDWEFLTDQDAATLKAICDQIIPADEFPSASEAGVLTYIDRQLTRHYRRHQEAYLAGLAQVDRMSRQRFGVALATASAQQQLAVVRLVEAEEHAFFQLVRNHTLEGYYGSPRHGGNRDAVSWRMLGINDPPLRGRAQYDLRKGPSQ